MNVRASFLASTPDAVASSAHTSERNLFTSFALASLVVIFGVLGAWVAVKRDVNSEELLAGELPLNDLPTAVQARTVGGVGTLLEQADVAFAAGRIVEPRFDNALYFYQAVLEQAPEDAGAQAGLDRVVQWLVGEMNVALDGAEFALAEDFAGQVVVLRPDDGVALARLERVSGIRNLTLRGSQQRSAGEDEAAARTYQQLLALDPGNLRAREGLRSAVVGLVQNGMSAAADGRLEVARDRLEQARQVDAGAPGLTTLAARLDEMERATQTEARERAVAAIRAAIRDEPVLATGPGDMFASIDDFQRTWSDEALADDLRSDARLALVERARAALGAGDLQLAETVLERAAQVGVDAEIVANLRAALAHRGYLAAFERGDWQLLAMSDLTVIEQVAPTFPNRADRYDGGWVNVEFTVAADGSVRDATVQEASARVFVSSSMAAIAQWRFEPEMFAGRPVPARAVVRFTFRNEV